MSGRAPSVRPAWARTYGAEVPCVEPPTAYPHGGRCGGWKLDTSGYPIRDHRIVLNKVIRHNAESEVIYHEQHKFSGRI